MSPLHSKARFVDPRLGLLLWSCLLCLAFLAAGLKAEALQGETSARSGEAFVGHDKAQRPIWAPTLSEAEAEAEEEPVEGTAASAAPGRVASGSDQIGLTGIERAATAQHRRARLTPRRTRGPPA